MKIINEMQELSEDYPDDLSAKEILDRTMVLMQENQIPFVMRIFPPYFLVRQRVQCTTMKIISCYAKCARTCWHTKVYDGWLVMPAVLLLLL